ncbi:septum formation protein Maf [Candidatus Peribacteria bacterium RIFCSPHIGHO2_01_FULL_55_13]|nr:MAG: septum formation protein Maf [Candidatus Peribacteria bacterium RIFCSPHIGHO2_01_FULL_55_13]
MRFILASASPQRRELLKGLGMAFDVVPSGVDESAYEDKDPAKRAQVLARMKAEDVQRAHSDCWVLGCDTLVVASDGTLLEKPKDAAEAEKMLRLQSGAISVIHSGLCLIGPSSRAEGISSSRVHFKKLSEEEIAWWIGTGQWKDRSGAFQIDGKGQLMIEHLEGDFTSVVGLPVFLLGELMKKTGVNFNVAP